MKIAIKVPLSVTLWSDFNYRIPLGITNVWNGTSLLRTWNGMSQKTLADLDYTR